MFKSEKKKIKQKIDEVVAILQDELNVSEAEARAAFEGTRRYLILTLPESGEYMRSASRIADDAVGELFPERTLKDSWDPIADPEGAFESIREFYKRMHKE